jgi:signal transduction histidine kinase
VLAVLVILGLTHAIQAADQQRQDSLAAAQQARLEALQRIQDDLEEKEALRRKLIRHTVIAQEDERARIARELHDETAQFLTALSLNLATLRDCVPREPRADDLIARLQSLSRQMGQGIYRLMHDLRPAQLDDLGLGAALQHLADDARRSSQVNITVQVTGSRQRLDPLVETVLFRVAQEALANVVRHAGCSQAWIELETDTDQVVLRIRDEGAGFNPDQPLVPPHGWGIAGMRERVGAVEGQLRILSAPGEGTQVEACIPLPEPKLKETEENERKFDTADVG